MIFRPTFPFLFLTVASLALVSCGDSGSDGLVEKTLSEADKGFRIPDSSVDRFRYQTRPAEGGDSSGQGEGGPRLSYTTPEGWTDLGPAPMRDINLSFGENGEGECYVARLPGAGGGLVANVNRWRNQMGAEPLTDEEVVALEEKPLFRQPAKYVVVDGDYNPGMGSTEVKKDQRLLGLILAADAGAVFVKMTGPRELVLANEAAFDEFTRSIDVSMP